MTSEETHAADEMTEGPEGRRTAYATYGGPVATEGDPAEAAALATLWAVEDADARSFTHGFHAYAGRMHPTTARRAVARYSAPGGRVLDPFCGGGTTLVEAYVAGRAAIGSDVSALATQLARVRTTPMDATARHRLATEADRIAERARDMALRRVRPAVPPGANEEFVRFDPHVAFELFALREGLFDRGPVDAVVRALRLCLSSILVKCLRREAPQSARDRAEGSPPEARKIARGLPSKWFAERARELVRGLADVEAAAPAGTPAPEVTTADARTLAHVGDGSCDLVLTSPPYAGIYDYEAEHAVRFAWLGLPKDGAQWGVRDAALGGANPGSWIEGRRRWIAEIARVLKRGGRFVCVVGDGVVGARVEDAAAATTAAADAVGLRFLARASQERRALSPAAAGPAGTGPRREHLLLLAKS